MTRAAMLIGALIFTAALCYAGKSYSTSGLVLKVDEPHRIVLISCQSIPGYMEAMVMPFSVRDPKDLKGLAPGAFVDFALVVEQDSSYADHICIRRYQSLELDPLAARRMKIVEETLAPSSSAKVLKVGEHVSDFTLIDQDRRRVSLHQFAGKVVVVSFIYTRCPLPNYCFRLSNNFGNLQRRFAIQLGRDVMLLSITFDPIHDQPDVLAKYASIWKANPEGWRFLTGPETEVENICRLFGIDAWLDEGTLIHSLHTAVIDRQSKLVANLEGNEFTAAQLGDLVQAVLNR